MFGMLLASVVAVSIFSFLLTKGLSKKYGKKAYWAAPLPFLVVVAFTYLAYLLD